jgi:dTDP-4-dehydrorhamnose 3,5-epimerase
MSTSAAGVLRGLHYHRSQLDYWVVSSGRAFVALVDVRPVIAGRGAAVVDTRELVADEWVVIPAGVAHGFLALEPLDMIYLVTNEFDGSDELGFAWDDPAVGVPWPAVDATPDGRPILSDRDRSNPSLAELVASLRA